MLRVGLVAALLCSGRTAIARSQTALIDDFLAADARVLDTPRSDSAHNSFDALAREASACQAIETTDKARCVVDSLFASDELVTVPEPGDPQSSTVTSALGSHRGNCAALTALALALAERVSVPMEAVVFPRHVVVRARGDENHVFELLARGGVLSVSQLRNRLGPDGKSYVAVRPRDFLPYYLDNLAVRLADAGDGDRAVAMFENAIAAGPRVSRIRFNYGTYLLEQGQLEAAEKQLRRAIRLESDSAAGWANLGVVVAKQGDTTEARRCFERALRHDRGNRIAAENLKALDADESPPRP